MPQSTGEKPTIKFKHDVPISEDYRWAVLKDKLGPFWFQIFNATFIAPFQSALILLFWYVLVFYIVNNTMEHSCHLKN